MNEVAKLFNNRSKNYDEIYRELIQKGCCIKKRVVLL